MVALVGLVGDPQTITKALNDRVSSVGPPSAADTFNAPIEGLTKSSGAAGVLVFVATSRSSSALSSTPSANEAVSSRPGPQAPAAGRPAPAA